MATKSESGTDLCVCGHGHRTDPKLKTRSGCASGNCNCTTFEKAATITRVGNSYELTDTDGSLWLATYEAKTKLWSLKDPTGEVRPLAGANLKALQPILVRNILEIRDELAEAAKEAAVTPVPVVEEKDEKPVEEKVEEKPAAPKASTKERVKAAAAPKAEKVVTEADREKAKERIQLLIRLGNDPGATDGERQNALARAAEMMLRYNLDEATVRREAGDTDNDLDKIVWWTTRIDTKGGHGQARAHAVMTLLQGFGAEVFWTWDKNGRYLDHVIEVHAAAAASIRDITKVWMPAALAEMEKGANKVSRARSKEARAQGLHHSLHGGLARQAYMVGFTGGIRAYLEATRKSMADEASESQALVLRDQASLLQTWVKDPANNWPQPENRTSTRGAFKLKADVSYYLKGHDAGFNYAAENLASDLTSEPEDAGQQAESQDEPAVAGALSS